MIVNRSFFVAISSRFADILMLNRRTEGAGGAMRKFSAVCAAVSVAASGFVAQPSFAQTQQTTITASRSNQVDKTPQLAAAIKSFPSGGPALRRYIADLIVKDPDAAAPLARYVLAPNDMNAAQKEAVEAGLADALNRLGIVAQVPGISPLLLGLLAVGGVIGLTAVIVNNSKNDSSVSGN